MVITFHAVFFRLNSPERFSWSPNVGVRGGWEVASRSSQVKLEFDSCLTHNDKDEEFYCVISAKIVFCVNSSIIIGLLFLYNFPLSVPLGVVYMPYARYLHAVLRFSDLSSISINLSIYLAFEVQPSAEHALMLRSDSTAQQTQCYF